MPVQLILGTHNAKKLKELRELLPPDRLDLKTLAEVPGALEVEETGTTFRENAALKATQQAKHLKRWVLAEDSGLCVDALKGEPGVYSARFAGKQGDDEANNNLLLERLLGVPWDQRGAQYECHICLSDPDGNARLEASGICRGRIRESRYGTGGFGYDPMFEVLEYHQTFGQLGAAVKRAISHRARALRIFIPQMLRILTDA